MTKANEQAQPRAERYIDDAGRAAWRWPNGIVQRGIRHDPERFAAFLNAIRAGDNIVDIALRFGVDLTTVLHHKRKLGIGFTPKDA